jgi:type IV pilus biogenesis protein CpaD/CtpE
MRRAAVAIAVALTLAGCTQTDPAGTGPAPSEPAGPASIPSEPASDPTRIEIYIAAFRSLGETERWIPVSISVCRTRPKSER